MRELLALAVLIIINSVEGATRTIGQDDCINCLDVKKYKYCQDANAKLSLTQGWCCDNIMDFIDSNCFDSKRTCTSEVPRNQNYYKYLICPDNSDKCKQGPQITVQNSYPFNIKISPLSFTEYCNYQISMGQNIVDFGQAIKISFSDLYYAQIYLAVNFTNFNTPPAYDVNVNLTASSIYQFSLRDRVTMVIRPSAKSVNDFVDFAQVTFKVYMDTYNSSLDLSVKVAENLTNSTSSSDSQTTTSNESIFDTYSSYFNDQSYQVSMIVVGFSAALIGWMFLILILACVYRYCLERQWAPEDYNARQEAKKLRMQRENEEEKLMKEMQHQEHNEHDLHKPKADPEDKYINQNPEDLEAIKFTPVNQGNNFDDTDKKHQSYSKEKNKNNQKQTLNENLLENTINTQQDIRNEPFRVEHQMGPQLKENEDVEEIQILKNPPQKQKRKLQKKKVIEEPQNYQTRLDQSTNSDLDMTHSQLIVQDNNNRQNQEDLEDQQQQSDQIEQSENISQTLEKISEESDSVHSSLYRIPQGPFKSKRSTAKSGVSKGSHKMEELKIDDDENDDDSHKSYQPKINMNDKRSPLNMNFKQLEEFNKIEEKEELEEVLKSSNRSQNQIENSQHQSDVNIQENQNQIEQEQDKSNLQLDQVHQEKSMKETNSSFSSRKTKQRFKEAKVVPIL